MQRKPFSAGSMETARAGSSVLEALQPGGRDQVLRAFVGVFEALDRCGHELRSAKCIDPERQPEIAERVSAILHDAPKFASIAFLGAAQRLARGDRWIAQVLGTIAGHARHLIHAAGGDHLMPVRHPIPGSFEASMDDARDEFWHHLLRMTPHQMKDALHRDLAAFEGVYGKLVLLMGEKWKDASRRCLLPPTSFDP